ncbi:MAG: hypothetical protein IGS39_17120 [Calothrix sp. C42_A2020_038]|nr:hypothetical protein [Calothrix sp. C42_A2020_038]
MVRLIVIILLVLLLSGCNKNPLTPTNGLIKKAIAIQVEQTQQQLSKQLDLSLKGFDIKHLAIKQQKYQTINSLPAYRVQGTYDLSLKLNTRELSQSKKPFDIYMQLQKEGKTWRLLQPEKENNDNGNESEVIWRSYLIE